MTPTKSSKERFFQSCMSGDLNTIKTELFYNVSPFSQDKYGNNALHLACMNNQPEVLNYLLKSVKTFKNDVPNKLGRTALNIAASQGAFECIDVLLNNLHCDINSVDKIFKNTPLHWCITSKCIKGVKTLLNSGADFMLVNKLGKTPLQLAKTTCLNIFYSIDEYIKNKNKEKHLHSTSQINSTTATENSISSELPYEIKKNDKCSRLGSKLFQKTLKHHSSGDTLVSDLTSNDSNESFFLNISKLKHGDNSVLNFLEKSIEPVDETSFVSSILNSGKVIQLTEAGLLALEYTKNEINTPIPDRIVKSFLTTSQKQNENEYQSINDAFESDNEIDSKTLNRGLKRIKSPQPCSKRFKCTETTSNKKSEVESLFEQLSSKTSKTKPIANNCSSYYSHTTTSTENSKTKNNEICNQNQLVCLNPDVNTQQKWIEDLICLFQSFENSEIMDQKSIEPLKKIVN